MTDVGREAREAADAHAIRQVRSAGYVVLTPDVWNAALRIVNLFFATTPDEREDKVLVVTKGRGL